jgi:hypothetical protein
MTAGHQGEGMDKTAVMVCGHGSRDTDAIREFELVAAGIKAIATSRLAISSSPGR